MKKKLIEAAARCRPGLTWADHEVIQRKDNEVFNKVYDDFWREGTYVGADGPDHDMWFLLLCAEAVGDK